MWATSLGSRPYVNCNHWNNYEPVNPEGGLQIHLNELKFAESIVKYSQLPPNNWNSFL